MTDNGTAEARVKAVHPYARIDREKTYGGCELFTCKLFDTAIGPTAFTEETAWQHAAERLK